MWYCIGTWVVFRSFGAKGSSCPSLSNPDALDERRVLALEAGFRRRCSGKFGIAGGFLTPKEEVSKPRAKMITPSSLVPRTSSIAVPDAERQDL